MPEGYAAMTRLQDLPHNALFCRRAQNSVVRIELFHCTIKLDLVPNALCCLSVYRQPRTVPYPALRCLLLYASPDSRGRNVLAIVILDSSNDDPEWTDVAVHDAPARVRWSRYRPGIAGFSRVQF